MVLCFNNKIDATAGKNFNHFSYRFVFFFLTQSLLQKLRLKNIFQFNVYETGISPGLSVISCMCKFALPEFVHSSGRCFAAHVCKAGRA